jgi:signal transduction histidine kinase
MNIKTSLTLKFTGIVAAILLVFSVFTYQFSEIFRKNAFTDRIQGVAEKVAKSYLEQEVVTPDLLKVIYQKQLTRFPNERLIIADSSKNIIFSSHPPKAVEINLLSKLVANKTSLSENVGDTEYVAFNSIIQNKEFYIINSAVDIAGQQKLDFLKSLLLILNLGSIFLAAITGWVFSKNALSPIKAVIEQVDNINENNLHERVNEGNGKDEIAALAINFNKMLERIERSFFLQKMFVANASHEFRTPLTSMKGQIEVMLLSQRAPEEYQRTFKSLLEDIENQIELINGLNELAKANANFPNITFKDISVIEVFLETKEELKKRKPHYKINLNLEDFPEDEGRIKIRGDHALLKSVFINITENACKFSRNHSCNVRLIFGEEEVTIIITDKGPGISKQDLPHIFEPFFRSNETRNVQGYGIGLSLVKKTVEMHKGKVTIESNVGVGTTVKVQLKNLHKNKNLQKAISLL